MKLATWTATIAGTLSLAACDSIPPGDYCDVYQRVGPISEPSADALLTHDPDAVTAIIANETTARNCK